MLNGVQSFDRVDSFCGLGDSIQHHPHSRCYHQAGVELLPDCRDDVVAYLFIFIKARDTGHCCPNSFAPFTGTVSFRGKPLDFHDRSQVHGLFSRHPELFRLYESCDSFFRYILVGDQAERRIGFFYSDDGELDHIMLN